MAPVSVEIAVFELFRGKLAVRGEAHLLFTRLEALAVCVGDEELTWEVEIAA